MAASFDLRLTFFQECEELLEALDDGLNRLTTAGQRDPAEPEIVNAVFRAVHSIKGGGAAFGLDALVWFAHQFETALDAMRSGRLPATAEVLRLLLRSADHLAGLIAAARDDQPANTVASQDLSERLAQLVSDKRGPSATSADRLSAATGTEGELGSAAFQPVPLFLDAGPEAESPARYRIRFAASRQLYQSGNDTTYLFRALAELGEVEAMVDTTALPGLADLDWAEAYLSWDLVLQTTESLQGVQEVFEFVDGLCRLDIIGPEPDGPPPLGPVEILPAAPCFAADGTVGSRPSSTDPVPPAPPDRGAAAGRNTAPGISGQKGTVRVDLDLVDRLINIVGELVINQAVLAQCVQDAGFSGQSDIGTGLDEFRNLARELQENIMAIRAQPVKPLFQRMARIVREASDLAGKTVVLETEGETVEVDKTVIERLVDPLTHILRNAVDHGLETPQDRQAHGKPEVGRIRLSAAHRSGRVLIEIADDGAGINRPKVRKLAAERGLIAPDALLEDGEIDELIFLPGFSTAARVTDLSGRGVGMDVVRSTIDGLGGRVSISSRDGQGTTISISLPLTLAVLDGMVVDIAGQTMVVPITAIIETLRPSPGDVHHVAASGSVVSVRESFVPIIDLAESFGYRPAGTDYSTKVLLLVESASNDRWALAVDHIHDQRQVVIKGLETNYGHVPGVAAATILGDGKIALIIDPDETAQRRRRPAVQATIPIAEEV